MQDDSPAGASAEPRGPIAVSHAQFARGLPLGRFHVVVNPDKARKYVKHRLMILPLTLPLLGVGSALALSGYPWAGLPLVVLGGLLYRGVTRHAAKILLHLASSDARSYAEAIEFEILEVQWAATEDEPG